MLILVDCGTTNMRLRLYCGEQGGETSALPAPIAEVKYQMGVRDAAREGSSEALKDTLSAGIRELLSYRNIPYTSRVYARHFAGYCRAFAACENAGNM